MATSLALAGGSAAPSGYTEEHNGGGASEGGSVKSDERNATP